MLRFVSFKRHIFASLKSNVTHTGHCLHVWEWASHRQGHCWRASPQWVCEEHDGGAIWGRNRSWLLLQTAHGYPPVRSTKAQHDNLQNWRTPETEREEPLKRAMSAVPWSAEDNAAAWAVCARKHLLCVECGSHFEYVLGPPHSTYFGSILLYVCMIVKVISK